MCDILSSNEGYKDNKARTMIGITGVNRIYVAPLDRVIREGLSGKGHLP